MVVFGLLAVIGGPSTEARAADEPRFVVDTYDMIGGCPDEATFRAEVEQRVHARPKAPLHVVVRVVQQPRNIDGSVEVIEPNGARSTRNVSSTRCAEIVSAAALVVALAIDDAAEGATEPRPGPVTPPGEVIPTVAPLTIETGPRRPVQRDDLVLRVGAQAGVQTAVGPNPVLGVPLFVELGSEARSSGLHVEPRARLAWTFATSSRGEVAAGTASFAWASGALDLCPVRLALTTGAATPLVDVRACGRFELGRIAADGEGTGSPTRSESRLWLGAAVPFTGRVTWPGLGGLFLEAEAGPRVPLVRDRFVVGPSNSLVFRPAALGVAAGLGAGLTFR